MWMTLFLTAFAAAICLSAAAVALQEDTDGTASSH
jgi:hypothetical protein